MDANGLLESDRYLGICAGAVPFWRVGRCNFVGGLHVVLTPNHLFLNSLLGHPGKARRANEINAHNRLRKEQLR